MRRILAIGVLVAGLTGMARYAQREGYWQGRIGPSPERYVWVSFSWHPPAYEPGFYNEVVSLYAGPTHFHFWVYPDHKLCWRGGAER